MTHTEAGPAVTRQIDGRVLWANLHLLFWLSLFPFATGWMGENHFSALPSALYGVVLLMAAIAYFAVEMGSAHRPAALRRAGSAAARSGPANGLAHRRRLAR